VSNKISAKMAVSDIDEDFKRTLEERKEYWNPIEKGLQDLEDLLRAADLDDAEPHFKRLTHYLDKCKDTDFEYNWNELKHSLQEPTKGFKVVGDQSVVDFLDQNPDYFEQAQEEAANNSIPEPTKKNRKSCPARFKKVDKQKPPSKQHKKKEDELLNECGTLNRPHLVAVTKNRSGKRPRFFVNIDGDIRALRMIGNVSADGCFMTICSFKSQCNCRHRVRIKDRNLFYKAKKRFETAPEIRHFMKEDDPRIFDRSSYEMIAYDSNTGLTMSPLKEHTCDKTSVESVIAALNSEGRLGADAEEHIENEESEEDLVEKGSVENEIVFSNKRGTAFLPHLVAVVTSTQGLRPKFYVNINGDIRYVRYNGILNADGSFVACCQSSLCKSSVKIQIKRKHLFEIKGDHRRFNVFKTEVEKLYDRSSYEIIGHNSREHICERINPESVIEALKAEGRLETNVKENIQKEESEEDLVENGSVEKEIVFSNERGTAYLPHLVAVVKSAQGKIPKFFVNIDGHIRSVRYNSTVNSDGTFSAYCTAKRQCRSVLKFQILRKHLYEHSVKHPRFNSLKSETKHVYDRSSYEIIAGTSREHTCDKISPEFVIKSLKDEGQLPKDANISSFMEGNNPDENNTDAHSVIESEFDLMEQETTDLVVKDREGKEIILHNKRGTLNQPHLIAVAQSRKGRLPKFYVNIEGSIRAMRASTLNKSAAFMAVCSATTSSCPTRHKILVKQSHLINKSNPEKHYLVEGAKNLFDRSSYEIIAYDSITGVAMNKLTDHICEELSLEDVVKALIKEGRLDEGTSPSSFGKKYRQSIPTSGVDYKNDKSTSSKEESMETEQVSDHEEEHRSRNTSREDELVKEGVGEVNQPHLIAVGPGKVVENRLVFYVNVCNKFYKMRHGTLNLKGECTLVCCNAQPYRGRASCGAKSKLRVLDDSLYTQDESSMVPKFVQGAPNLFNSDSYRIEMYEKSHPHTCCGENITYEEIRFMLSNVRIINPKRFQIESGDPNCKPSEELASIESGVCMGCSRKFSETDLLIEHILKFHRCSDTYVATYANFCFICMESHKFLKTHYCDVNNSKIQTSAALKELHIATWEIYNGEPWQSKLVNRVEILPSKLRRSVLGNSLNEDKIFDESAKGFNCYPVESGQCSSCHDNCETWQGLFDHLEDNRYYLCREYYTYKGYCFICSKFYSKVSQHFNDVRRGKCSSLATETREIHKEFQERFIFKKPEFPATPRTSTPQKKSSNSAVSCGDGSMTMLNNRGEQILLPEKCHNIESGKCSSCLEQFDSWECLVDHLRENQDCQNYCTQRYASYCFICSRPYKNVKGHFNDILGGKVNCSVDIRRIHRTMKPLYIPIPRLNRMVKTGKRSKKRVIQKTQSANSSDEDESFHVRKKCRNRIGPLGMATPSPSNMKEQVIEGIITLLLLIRQRFILLKNLR